MNSYRKAFDVFEVNHDDIFILLTSRLIIHHLEEHGNYQEEKELEQFKNIFEVLVNSEELEELNFETLFENFDHRIGLAKHIAKTMRNVELGALQNRMNTLNRNLTLA